MYFLEAFRKIECETTSHYTFIKYKDIADILAAKRLKAAIGFNMNWWVNFFQDNVFFPTKLDRKDPEVNMI